MYSTLLIASLSSQGLQASAMQLPGPLHDDEVAVKPHRFTTSEAMLEVSANGFVQSPYVGEASVYDDVAMLQVLPTPKRQEQHEPIAAISPGRPGEAADSQGRRQQLLVSAFSQPSDLPLSAYEGVWTATGCTDLRLFDDNDLTFWRSLSPEEVFADIYSWCAESHPDHAYWCCGSYDCAPESCELQTAWPEGSSAGPGSGGPSAGPGGDLIMLQERSHFAEPVEAPVAPAAGKVAKPLAFPQEVVALQFERALLERRSRTGGARTMLLKESRHLERSLARKGGSAGPSSGPASAGPSAGPA